MTNQAQTHQARITPSGLVIPDSFTAYQAEYMLVIDASVTKHAEKVAASGVTALSYRALAREAKASGLQFLEGFNTDLANQMDKGLRYFAVCQFMASARGGHRGTALMFLQDYLDLLEASLARQAELARLAQHVCFCSQFDPSDDTWAAIKVYRDGNPLVIDDGFATQDEAEDCAELARDAELAFGAGRHLEAAE